MLGTVSQGACVFLALVYCVIPQIYWKDSTTVLHSPSWEILFMRHFIRLCGELTLFVTSELLLDLLLIKRHTR